MLRPPSVSCRIASGAIPTPPPTSSARRSVGGRAEAAPERPERPQPLARPQLAQPPRAGPDVLEQEVRLAVAARARPRRRAAGTGAHPRPRPSARRPRASRTGRAAGARPVGVGDPQHAVGAERLAAMTVSRRRPKRRAGACAPTLTPPRVARVRTGARRRRRAAPAGTAPRARRRARARAIARAADTPAASVVRQGMPCATAARRISQPSVRAPEPVGVLTTRSTSPRSIQSSTCGEPSPILFRRCTGHAHARDRLGGAARGDDLESRCRAGSGRPRTRPPCRSR